MMKHLMCTITIGVLDDYKNEDFYTKDKDFQLEKQRVDLKFKNYSQEGIFLFMILVQIHQYSFAFTF